MIFIVVILLVQLTDFPDKWTIARLMLSDNSSNIGFRR